MSMKTKYQEFFRVIVFFVVLFLLLSSISAAFIPKWEGEKNEASKVTSFYQQPRNSIDVLFIGASSFRDGLSPLIMWEKNGISSYLRVSSTQSPMVSYYLLVEAERYQKPKLVVIDGVSLFYQYDVDETEPFLRTGVDPLRMSPEKAKIAFYIASHSDTQTMTSYLFPLLRYHSRWDEISINDFRSDSLFHYDYLRGHYPDTKTTSLQFPDHFMDQFSQSVQYEEESLEYVRKIINYCKKNDIQVLLLTLPRLTWNYSKHTIIQNIADEYGLIYLDYSLPEYIKDFGIDASTDFSDPNHLNVEGSIKISKNLSSFLKETYDLPDRRNDTAYEAWNIDLAKFYTFLSENGLSHLITP